MTEDVWELYHVAADFSMSNNLASKYPNKVKELQAVFLAEAVAVAISQASSLTFFQLCIH